MANINKRTDLKSCQRRTPKEWKYFEVKIEKMSKFLKQGDVYYENC